MQPLLVDFVLRRAFFLIFEHACLLVFSLGKSLSRFFYLICRLQDNGTVRDLLNGRSEIVELRHLVSLEVLFEHHTSLVWVLLLHDPLSHTLSFLFFYAVSYISARNV
jgi:hypothetical protein